MSAFDKLGIARKPGQTMQEYDDETSRALWLDFYGTHEIRQEDRVLYDDRWAKTWPVVLPIAGAIVGLLLGLALFG